MKLPKQSDFFKKYNLKKQDYESTGLKWDDLELIFDNYSSIRDSLENSATAIFSHLMKIKNVHSVRYRVKDPEHLIEKIIRKRIESPGEEINIENYREKVTDLIGLRALHLFKEEWEVIHDAILSTWTQKQDPVANYREGDSEAFINSFVNSGCVANKHKYGYRSVHYIIESQPTREKFYAEIQVRTIFEEAWSEIDHSIRYPYEVDNIVYSKFLMILNRLAGSADEMGSFINFLKDDMQKKDTVHKRDIEEKDKIIEELSNKIEGMKLKKADKEYINEKVKILIRPKYIDLNEHFIKELNSTKSSVIRKGISLNKDKKLDENSE